MEQLYTKELKAGVPIVNHIDIKDNVSKEVMIFGKIASRKDETLFLNTTSSGDSTIIVKGFRGESKSEYIAIIGTVQIDGSLLYKDCFTEEMENFDFLDNLNKLLDLVKNKKDLKNFI